MKSVAIMEDKEDEVGLFSLSLLSSYALQIHTFSLSLNIIRKIISNTSKYVGEYCAVSSDTWQWFNLWNKERKSSRFSKERANVIVAS